MTAATWILLYKKPQDAAATGEALKFFAWSYAKGGKMAEELDYVPMPAKVVTDIQKMWSAGHQGRQRQAAVLADELKNGPSRRTGCRRAAATATDCHPERYAGPSNRRRMRRVSEATLNGTSVQRAESSSRASVLRRLRTSDLVFHGLTRAAAITVLVLLSGVILALIIGSAPALSTFGLSLRHHRGLEPGDRAVRRPGADLRHPRHLGHRHADRRAGRPHGRVLPHRALPADRCAGRSPSPSSCWPASPASSTASGACSCSRRSCRSTCSRS